MAIENKKTLDWIKFVIYIITLIVAVTLAYGQIDRRVTILEVKQEKKVDGEELQLKLKQWKNEIVVEIRNEIKNLRNK